MPLAPGTFVGPCEILAPLGAGGMGEVYRARDTKLKRDVALNTVSVEHDGTRLRAGKPELFRDTPLNDNGPTFSPAGRWLA